MYSLVHYQALDGNDLFAEWIGSLQDTKAQARIAADYYDLRMVTLVTVGPLAKAFGSFGSIGDRAIGSTMPSSRSG
jgi:hypothetical protein